MNIFDGVKYRVVEPMMRARGEKKTPKNRTNDKYTTKKRKINKAGRRIEKKLFEIEAIGPCGKHTAYLIDNTINIQC